MFYFNLIWLLCIVVGTFMIAYVAFISIPRKPLEDQATNYRFILIGMLALIWFIVGMLLLAS